MASLEALPVELSFHVLTYLDVPNLILAVQGAPTLRRALLDGLSTYSNHFLRSIPTALHSDIVALGHFMTLGPRPDARSGVETYLKLLKAPESSVNSIGESSPTAVIQGFPVHELVESLALAYAGYALSDGEDDLRIEREDLSTSEYTRICRAFYRFHIYCQLFSQRKHLNHHVRSVDQKSNFFDHFAPWENEQFACIFEFLFDIVIKCRHPEVSVPSNLH